jgi:hypothetical protein
MRRLIITLTAIAIAAFIAGFHEWAPPAHAASSSCGNSFTDDGHPGPWRTTANGGTWHGNTVQVSCPTQSTYWNMRYCLQADGDQGSGTVWVNEECIMDDGFGDAQESFSWSPEPCSPYGFRTHVVNFVTGGTINKPSGGASVKLACG